MNGLNSRLIDELVQQQRDLGRADNTITAMYSAYSRVSEYINFDIEGLKSINKKQAQDIIIKMANKDGHSNSTIKLTRTYLNSLYSFVELESPFRATKLPTQKRHEDNDSFDFFEIDQVKEILARAKEQNNFHDKRDIALMNLLFSSGVRKSECIRLNREDVNFENSKIVLWNTKREAKKTIVVSSNTMEAIKDYLDSREDDLQPLFISSYKKRFSTSGFDTAVKKMYALAGLDNTIHATRHTTASLLADMGKSLPEIQSHLRHKSGQTTLKYISASEERKRNVAEALNF